MDVSTPTIGWVTIGTGSLHRFRMRAVKLSIALEVDDPVVLQLRLEVDDPVVVQFKLAVDDAAQEGR